jgi:protoheme IX farnesyltransferase
MKAWTEIAHDLFEMTKPRICLLALSMASLGYALATPGHVAFPALGIALLGIALVGACCGALNQFLERDIDARMWRTMRRPLPAGRLAPQAAVWMGAVTGIAGLVILAVWVNPLTAILGAATIFFYVCLYTPSKRWSTASTLIGAVPGAMPPLMGWTAASGTLSIEGILLFAILFIWQIPHFLSIAWIYREDYARASLPILSVVDEQGVATSKQVIVYSVALLPLTLLPTIWGVTGGVYFFGAMALGLIFLASGIGLAIHRSKAYARRLFLVSILYLPALGLLMIWDRKF